MYNFFVYIKISHLLKIAGSNEGNPPAWNRHCEIIRDIEMLFHSFKINIPSNFYLF